MDFTIQRIMLSFCSFAFGAIPYSSEYDLSKMLRSSVDGLALISLMV